MKPISYRAWCQANGRPQDADRYSLEAVQAYEAYKAAHTGGAAANVVLRCAECGAPGAVDSRGRGISCGCAAEWSPSPPGMRRV